jgi:glycosyltransferase involved in cell wall biosynthesis
MNTIESVKTQTYPVHEIIVINDCSSDPQYNQYDWEKNNIRILHTPSNSKKQFGYASAGYVRNQGLAIATGDYIAFCDDDDIWFPKKLEYQVQALNECQDCEMSCTDGLFGYGVYDPNKKYKIYNREYYYPEIKEIFHRKQSHLLDSGFPRIFTGELLTIHNCVICSSVLIKKERLDKIGGMAHLPNGMEDYDCWRRALEHTNCVYVKEICFYYNALHGDGHNY